MVTWGACGHLGGAVVSCGVPAGGVHREPGSRQGGSPETMKEPVPWGPRGAVLVAPRLPQGCPRWGRAALPLSSPWCFLSPGPLPGQAPWLEHSEGSSGCGRDPASHPRRQVREEGKPRVLGLTRAHLGGASCGRHLSSCSGGQWPPAGKPLVWVGRVCAVRWPPGLGVRGCCALGVGWPDPSSLGAAGRSLRGCGSTWHPEPSVPVPRGCWTHISCGRTLGVPPAPWIWGL